jgi:hypothetical protein
MNRDDEPEAEERRRIADPATDGGLFDGLEKDWRQSDLLRE